MREVQVYRYHCRQCDGVKEVVARHYSGRRFVLWVFESMYTCPGCFR